MFPLIALQGWPEVIKQVATWEMYISFLAMITTLLTIPGISCLPTEKDMPSGVEKRQSDEERLLEYLFTDYNPSARPVLNSSKTVNVTLMFSLMHIQELVSTFWYLIISVCHFMFHADSL